jgi:hypothetical protein
MNAYYDLLTDTITIEGITLDARTIRELAYLKVGGIITLTRKADKHCIRIVEKIA